MQSTYVCNVDTDSCIDLEKLLVDLGALKDGDVRLKKQSDSEDYRTAGDDELNIEDYDDDWD